MKRPIPTRRDRIRAQLADLKMPGALEALDTVLAQVDGGHVSAAEAIELVLGAQIARNNRRLLAAMRSSRLPAVKTVADFDLSFQPSLKREQVEARHELGFVERQDNVVFLGPPGVGKTHLAISLAIAAAQHGRRVYSGTLADLIGSLEEAKAAGRLTQRLKILTPPRAAPRLSPSASPRPPLPSPQARLTRTRLTAPGWVDARNPGAADKSATPGSMFLARAWFRLVRVARLAACAGSRSLFTASRGLRIRSLLAQEHSAAASHLAAGPRGSERPVSCSRKASLSRTTSATLQAARLLTSATRIHPATAAVKLFVGWVKSL
jgi:hypothetical protein